MILILRVLTIEINLAKDNNQRGLHTTSISFHWSCRLLRTILAHPPHSSSITFSICNDFDKEEENIASRAHLVKVNVLCNVAFHSQLETDSAVHFIVQVELVMLPTFSKTSNLLKSCFLDYLGFLKPFHAHLTSA